MIRYTLSPVAQRDLVEIRDYYLEQGSPQAARRVLVEFVEAFRTLTLTPALGHKREDLAEDRPILFWPVRDYLIVYRANRDRIEVVTVARASRDVRALLTRI